jgi:hypothetical protein
MYEIENVNSLVDELISVSELNVVVDNWQRSLRDVFSNDNVYLEKLSSRQNFQESNENLLFQSRLLAEEDTVYNLIIQGLST